jgi:hypothetical protein
MALNPLMVLCPSLQEYFVDKDTGAPLSGGVVTFYKDNDRTFPGGLKTVYTLNQNGTYDNSSYVELPNPLTLSSVGTFVDDNGNDIIPYLFPYDGTPDDTEENVELYFITVYSAEGDLQFSRSAWPNIVDGSEDVTVTNAYNFIRNSTFYSWSNGTSFSNVGTGSTSLTDFILDDWVYSQSDATQNITISQGVFTSGQNPFGSNSPYYLIYSNINSGSNASSYNYFAQTYKSVQTLSGSDVTAAIWLNQISGNTNATFTLTITQDFGTGGSPSTAVETNIVVVPSLTIGKWVKYTGTAPLPSVATKSIGTNGDDQLILKLNVPRNQVIVLGIGDSILEQGNVLQGNAEKSNDDRQKETNYTGLYPAWTTGDVKMTIKDEAPPGWLLMNNQTIGKPGSNADNVGFSFYALYQMIWENINSSVWATLFTSAGTVSTYGVSAQSDWNELKRLMLPLALGRTLAGANPLAAPAFIKYFNGATDVDPGDDSITVNSNSSLYAGTIIKFTGSGTLPTTTPQIIFNTEYAAIPVAASNKIKLATTVAQALTGTSNITIDAIGSGQLQIVVPSLTIGLGAFLGEELHGLTGAETIAHTHGSGNLAGTCATTVPGGTAGVAPNFITYGADVENVGGLTFPGVVTISGGSTGSTGGSGLHNTIQPTTYLNVMIKI